MASPMRGAIEALQEKIASREAEMLTLKRTVNMLAREDGEEPIYTDAELEASSASSTTRPDQYYGMSVITAARNFLESRKRACQAEEVVAALERGGFDFDTQGWKPDSRLRNLSIALSKNTMIFHRLPNGTYGMRAWYSNLPKKVAKAEKTEAADAGGGLPDGEFPVPPQVDGDPVAEVAARIRKAAAKARGK